MITPWKPDLNWSTPAGKALDALIAVLPASRAIHITIFGSAPLQMALDPHFLSADVDLFSSEDLAAIISANQLGSGERPVYIEQCAPSIFRAGPDWVTRSFSIRRGNSELTFPHPADIMVSKLSRLEEKDLRAVTLIQAHGLIPSESDLKQVLRNAVDIYKPAFAEEQVVADPVLNTGILWEHLYKTRIDVRQEIIVPALEFRRRYQIPPPHRSELREIAKKHG